MKRSDAEHKIIIGNPNNDPILIKNMCNSYLNLFVRRDKKILIICILLFYICYDITSSRKCIDRSTAPSHHFNKEVSSEYDQYEYAVLIASAPSNYERRDSIRNSWIKLANNIKDDSDNSGQWTSNHMNRLKTQKLNIRFLFAVGTGGLRRNDKLQLETENKMNGDMLIFDLFVDSYKALTPKMLLSLKWISKSMKRLKYLVKCDDDSFLRIDRIVHNLEEYAPAMDAPEISRYISHQEHFEYKGLYWGYFNGKARVFMSGKWEERNWFLCDRYLPYALGGAYVISRNIVDFIAKNADDFSQYNSEDVSMGVWTSSLDGINRVHDLRFDTSATSRGCSDDMLVRHKVSSAAMARIYQTLDYSDGRQFCMDEGVNNFYVYNWTVMPSMCCKVK